ncbi:MAG: cell division protein FtsA [Hellea sp.]|nr:cell division protein FtsA [Hellea sp.]
MISRGRKTKNEAQAVLDIGSSKVVCLIGQADPNMGVRILGSGFGVSSGLKSGAVVDIHAVEHGVRTAVEKAEREAGVAVQSVAVNVAVRSLRSEHLKVQTEFANGEVADRDLRRLVNSSLSEFAQPEQTILHAIPLSWSVDGERNIDEPRGMYGSSLGVDMHFVMAGVGPLRNLAHCIERCHLSINSVSASPYAAGLSVLTEDEKDLGVTLIDLGGGITSASVFRDNSLVHVETLAVGGVTLTKDIARGLMTPPEAAERIKMIYGSALHGADDDRESIPCPPMGAQDTLHHEPKSMLTGIIRSRIEEIFEILRDRMNQKGLDAYSGRRIVLTGGGAQLNGVRELAEYVFNKRARIGRPHGVLGLDESLSSPDFAVATGLLKYQFLKEKDVITGPPDLTGRRYMKKRYSGGSIGRSIQWLRENF